ncbi:11076_t:CDS:2, partial [Gigaspora rosea]
MNPESTYNELLANTMLPECDNMVNGIDTLYKNNQFEFDLGNQNENNFVVNSEAYQEEFQTDATFHEWDYANDRLDTLYTEHDISNNDKYDEFIRDFFEVQRINFITIFEYRWKCLLEKYNNENVVNYLQRLYVNKESWAKLFVLKLFTAGMSSTSRVESYNSKIKRLIFNSNTTLLELAEKLTACVLEEDKKTEYSLFRASAPKVALVATADTILPNVCNMLCKYLTVEVLRIQEDQIKQSLQYHAMIITQDELQRYLTINLDDSTLFSENRNLDIVARSMLDLVDSNKWYNETSSNSAQEPFLVAQKFEMEQSVTMVCHGDVDVEALHANVKTIVIKENQSFDNFEQAESHMKAFTKKMQYEVEFYMKKCHFGATLTRRILKEKYPHYSLYFKNLYAEIQRQRPLAKYNAVQFYKKLLIKQCE